MRVSLVAVALLACTAHAHADDALPEGAVVVLGPLDAAAALAAAREAGGARFRSEAFEAAERTPPSPPDAEAGELRARYLEADFLRCLARLSDPALDPARLLEHGHRDAAAAVAVFGAACAQGAADEALARQLLARAWAAGLPLADALAVTSPDFQTLAEATRAAQAGQDPVRVRVRTRPSQGTVAVDGVATCTSTPCELSLGRGEHVLVVERLGSSPRVMRRTFDTSAELRLVLDPAPADELRRQIGEALVRLDGPDEATFVRAVAVAAGARVLVLAWQERGRTHALVYDRAARRVVARTTVSGDDVPTAVRASVAEWRGLVEPTPLLEEPVFWLGTAGAALATGIVVFLLASPPEPRHDLVFRTR